MGMIWYAVSFLCSTLAYFTSSVLPNTYNEGTDVSDGSLSFVFDCNPSLSSCSTQSVTVEVTDTFEQVVENLSKADVAALGSVLGPHCKAN